LIACTGTGQRVVERFEFQGASMAPTIEHGTPIEVLDYGQEQPQRNDVIAFLAPTSVSRIFVKRIIGLPGDTIEIDEVTGRVSVSGIVLAEPYLASEGKTACGEVCAWTIPAPERVISLSYSQERTPRAILLESELEMRACAESGCYFVMGDNRQNSSDSRQGWLVPAENIIGWVDVGE